MKKKGFTLIELLAVIIILAVVAIVATPIVLDVIDTARRKANYQTAIGLINGAKNYYAESWLDESKRPNVENINNIYDLVDVSGEKPATGELYVNNKGLTAISVEIDGICYVKDFYNDLQELDSNDENCELGYIGVDENNPTVTYDITGTQGNDNWYITNAYVKINASDLESGISSYRWCTGTDCEPINEETENKTISLTDTNETQVCVIAYDKAGNSSGKVCSETIKVDTVLPEFSGIGDITVEKDAVVDLEKDVKVTDATSKIEGTYSYSPTSIDTTKTGITDVIYTVKDKAGNTKTITRKVTVSADVPSISYTVSNGIINEYGWAKEDFYVTINVTDNSGHGIKEFKVCTATSDTCQPNNGSVVTNSTSTTRLISTESNNNRICVQATDNYNQISSVICSDAYKLDKTAPTAGTIKVNDSSTIKEWYTSNVTITAVNGSDSLSGHASTTTNISSISTNTVGTDVIVTTKDKAGNTSTRTYTIKVDKTKPTVSIIKSVSNNQNVLTANLNPEDNTSGYSYKWYKDGSIISEGNKSYTTTTSGTYKLVVTTGSGISVTSNEITINSYTISYDLNGATGSIGSTTKIEDISTTITSIVPTRSGYTFLGWGISATSTTATYTSAASYTNNESVKLYAIWEVAYICSTGTLTYDASKGNYANGHYICITGASSKTVDSWKHSHSYTSSYDDSTADKYSRGYDIDCEKVETKTEQTDSTTCTNTNFKAGVNDWIETDNCRDWFEPYESYSSCSCDLQSSNWIDNNTVELTYNCYCTYTVTTTEYSCDYYNTVSTTSYYCPNGWSTYSNAGASSMKCYKQAE